MNIFELYMITPPIAGAISGGLATKSLSTFLMITSIISGFIVGIICYLFIIILFALFGRICHLDKQQNLNPLQQIILAIFLLSNVAAPIISWWLSAVICTRLFSTIFAANFLKTT